MTNIKKNLFELLKVWLKTHSEVCEIPKVPFVYSPKRVPSFAKQGEEMVDSLTKIGLPCFNHFSKFFDVQEQTKMAYETFESLKGTKYDKPGKKGQLGYFRTKRTFGSLVTSEYKRTPKAPRLTATGNTFHGMNKGLLIEIVRTLTMKNQNILIIDFDMSACHSRVAASLLPHDNILKEALEAKGFWETQVKYFLPVYANLGIDVNFKQLKRMLKVFLYTSLNGGNPASRDRLLDNLTGNAMEVLPQFDIDKSPVYRVTKIIAEDFKLVQEVKSLNKECFFKGVYFSYTSTIDRCLPYVNTASYKGISRVLQGFEVVLLCCLTQYVVELGGLPLSLDHDGLMVLFVLDENQKLSQEDIEQTIHEMETCLTNKMMKWSHYLLRDNMPIEAKRHWFQGEVVEY